MKWHICRKTPPKLPCIYAVIISLSGQSVNYLFRNCVRRGAGFSTGGKQGKTLGKTWGFPVFSRGFPHPVVERLLQFCHHCFPKFFVDCARAEAAPFPAPKGKRPVPVKGQALYGFFNGIWAANPRGPRSGRPPVSQWCRCPARCRCGGPAWRPGRCALFSGSPPPRW